MFIARWQVKAKFGHQGDAIKLMKEWDEAVGKTLNVGDHKQRYLTGHIGNAESLIVTEVEIENLAELDGFFSQLATVEIHKDWGRQLSEVVVSGSSNWEILRVLD